MKEKIERIALKIDNGGVDLTVKDLDYLVEKVRNANTVMQRINMVGNAVSTGEKSLNMTLDTIKNLAIDYLGAE